MSILVKQGMEVIRSPKRKREESPDEKHGIALGDKRRTPGVYKPEEEDRPIEVARFELSIFHRLQQQHIFVDGSSRELPGRVWFLAEEFPSASNDEFYRIRYHKGYTLNEEFEMSEASPGFLNLKEACYEVPGQESLETVLGLFEDLSLCIRFVMTNNSWASIRDQRKKHIRKIRKVLKKNPEVGCVFAQGDFVRAFRKNMTKSAGKDAVRSFLLLAAVVAHTKNIILKNTVACYSSGSSNPSDLFPVKPFPFVDSCDDVTIDDFALGDSASALESVSCTRSSLVSKVSGRKGVFADLVLFSGREPNWGHIVFVAEVQSGSSLFSEKAKVQLVKEMLGPMMRQSLVFGIMMNAIGAVICSMEQDFHNKEINVSFEYYEFRRGSYFCFEQFKAMFIHTVNAMIYSKTNMKVIYRGF